ncbi:MAG: hypothetical protein OXG35_26795 [Acidobacteria bacterium]|nr:hypothetical protein [Acidobacteriota bacterium]
MSLRSQRSLAARPVRPRDAQRAFTLVIENKVDATEQPLQCDDLYANFKNAGGQPANGPEPTTSSNRSPAEPPTALTVAGSPRSLLARRLYQDAGGAQYRYSPTSCRWRSTAAATLLFVQAEAEDETAVRTWSSQHAALWAALGAVEVVVVGRDRVRLAAAVRVLDKWPATPPEAVMMFHREAASELAAIKKAIATGDWDALETYRGLNPPSSGRASSTPACAAHRRSRAAITSGWTWRSMRVPEPAVASARPRDKSTGGVVR